MRIFGPGRSWRIATGPAGAPGGLAHQRRRLGVRLVRAVAEVQPRDVHARVDHPHEHLGITRGRADRGDDLGAAIHRAGRYTASRVSPPLPVSSVARVQEHTSLPASLAATTIFRSGLRRRARWSRIDLRRAGRRTRRAPRPRSTSTTRITRSPMRRRASATAQASTTYQPSEPRPTPTSRATVDARRFGRAGGRRRREDRRPRGDRQRVRRRRGERRSRRRGAASPPPRRSRRRAARGRRCAACAGRGTRARRRRAGRAPARATPIWSSGAAPATPAVA